MISSNMDPRLAASVADTKDLARFKTEMDGLKESLSGGGPDKMEQLRKACQNFEAVFIGKLWEQMKESVPKEGYLHSKEEDSYTSMFDRDFSEKMAQAGGIGLADMIYDQLSRKLKQASRETLSGGVDLKAAGNESIPLKKEGQGIALNRSKGMTLEDWGGTEVVNNGGKATAPAGAEAAAQGGETATEHSRVLTDVEVQARLESLTRKLEAERIREGLLHGTTAKRGYNKEEAGSGSIGRKLAEIG